MIYFILVKFITLIISLLSTLIFFNICYSEYLNAKSGTLFEKEDNILNLESKTKLVLIIIMAISWSTFLVGF